MERGRSDMKKREEEDGRILSFVSVCMCMREK